MATKSILKNVSITDRSRTRKFVNALENAESKVSKHVELSRIVRDIKPEDIKGFLGRQ